VLERGRTAPPVSPAAAQKVFTGSTVDAAIDAGLRALDLERDEVKIEVLSRGARGFLGIGSRPARVAISAQLDVASVVEEIARGVLSRMGIEAKVQAVQTGLDVVVKLECRDAGLLIGRKGETLEALQHLLLRMASRRSSGKIRDLRVDVGGYRDRREEQLREEALGLAERVERTGRRAMTEPLPPAERRIVHRALAEKTNVTTHVAGNGNVRRVIILPKSGRSDG
jgi:spoIIIJ-associated protein